MLQVRLFKEYCSGWESQQLISYSGNFGEWILLPDPFSSSLPFLIGSEGTSRVCFSPPSPFKILIGWAGVQWTLKHPESSVVLLASFCCYPTSYESRDESQWPQVNCVSLLLTLGGDSSDLFHDLGEDILKCLLFCHSFWKAVWESKEGKQKGGAREYLSQYLNTCFKKWL